jgi:hypothetical protein
VTWPASVMLFWAVVALAADLTLAGRHVHAPPVARVVVVLAGVAMATAGIGVELLEELLEL